MQSTGPLFRATIQVVGSGVKRGETPPVAMPDPPRRAQVYVAEGILASILGLAIL